MSQPENKQKNGIKQRFATIQSPLIAFFSAIAILMGSYMFRGIHPFGDKTLMLIDMYHQYVPFMAELIDKMHGSFNLFYSWSGGLGTNFYATISYYLASPLNLLLLFFGKSGVTEAVLVFTLVKVGLAAAFFFLWIRAYTGRDDFPGIAFALMYALSGYVLSYAWNIMWLDGVYMMPLVLMGMDRLIRGRSATLFTLSVCFLLAFNFYISFFVVLFTILYYPLLLERHGQFHSFRKVLKTTLRTAVFAIIGFFLSAGIVLPTVIAIRHTSASKDAFPTQIKLYDMLLDYFQRFFFAAEPTALEGKPNLYAGLAVLLLVPIYYFLHGPVSSDESAETGLHTSLKPTSRRWLVGSGLLFVFLLLSVNNNILDFIWHGFHFPNQLPYRNAFVFVFLTVTVSAEAFYRIGAKNGKLIGAVLAGMLATVLFVQKLASPELEWFAVYGTLAFLIAYAIVFAVRKESKKFFSTEFVFFLIVVLELSLNSFLVVKKIDDTMSYAPREGYAQGADVSDLLNAVDFVKQREPGFHRMEVLPAKTVNDPYLYSYRGMSIFSSMSADQVAKMMARYGYHSNDVNSYKYSSSIDLMDALLGIKYVVQRSEDDNQQQRPLVASFGDVRVFENQDALSIAYWAPAPLKFYTSKNLEPLEAQQQLAQQLGAPSPLYTPADIQNMGADNATITSDGAGQFTVNYPDKSKQAIVKLYMRVEKTGPYVLQYNVSPNQIGIGNLFIADRKVSFDSNRSCTVNVGIVEQGTEVVIELWPNSRQPGPHDFTMKAFSVDQSVYEQLIFQLRAHSLKVDVFRDGRVGGPLTAPEAGVVMTTIPYDAGWNVRVDGERVETFTIDSGFLGFYIKEGSHRIDMRFLPKGFLLGLEMTLMAALVLFVGLLRKWRFLTGEADNQVLQVEPLEPKASSEQQADSLERTDEPASHEAGSS